MARFEFNQDADARDRIIFGEAYCADKYGGGVRGFEGLGYETVKRLMDEKFIDPEDSQNWSPWADEFLEFLEGNRDFTAHGYAVSPERSDYRVTIEGVESEKSFDSLKEAEGFIHLCRCADEFSLDPPYAWWD